MVLLAITDRRMMGSDPIARIRDLLARMGPEVWVQIREKDLDARVIHAWVEAVLPSVRTAGSRLFVNTRADVVRCFAPEIGVHLPEDGLPIEAVRKLMPAATPIGASAHDRHGVLAKLEAGADLVTIAPVFEKHGGSVLGLEGLQTIADALAPDQRHRVFALGGITESNQGAVRRTGVECAAIRWAWSTGISGET